MLHKRADHSLVYCDGYIYAVGSFANEKFRSSCERYSIENNKWEKIAKMTSARSGVGLTVFNDNYIFAFGGRDNLNSSLNKVESYDIKKDTWTLINYANAVWPGAYLCQAHQINKDKVLVFGNSLA